MRTGWSLVNGNKPHFLFAMSGMISYNLYKLLKQELKNGSRDLVTRPSGQVIRERIERDIEREPNGTVIGIDFSGIGVIDFSCADEIIAKLLSRLLSNEYGEKYIFLAGLNDNQRENVEVALERKNLAVVAVMKNGKRRLLGSLNNYLKKTFLIVDKKRKLTAKELSRTMKIEANTSGTRLLNLYKKRLVKRIDSVQGGGRVWVYETLKGG